MKLFDIRLNISKKRQTEMLQLDKILKDLKKDKARDPNGWINDIFKEGVAGKDLKIAMLGFFNKMKSENFVPDLMRKADIATIHKRQR